MIELFKTSFQNDMPSMAPLSHLHSLGLPMEFAVYAGVPKIGLKEILRRGPEYGQAGMMRVDRARLRKWLMTGLEVQWGKKLSHHREEDGGVVAVFEHGEEVQGDVLVGADGVQSRVRKQLLPGIEPQRVPLRVAVGEVQVIKETYQRWFTLGRSYFTVFDGERRITVALKGVSEDGGTAYYYWIFGLQPEAGKEEEEETWSTREELHSFVTNNLDGIDERIQEILRATPAEGMLFPPLVIRDMLPPAEEAWSEGGRRVTLLGDAVHAMTPCECFEHHGCYLLLTCYYSPRSRRQHGHDGRHLSSWRPEQCGRRCKVRKRVEGV